MIIKELQILTEALWGAVKLDLPFFSPISSFVQKLSEFDYSTLDKESLSELNVYVKQIEGFFVRYRSKGIDGMYFPPRQTANNDDTVKKIVDLTGALNGMNTEQIGQEVFSLKPKNTGGVPKKGGKVFIGHGRSKLWARVQVFLKEDLNLESITFESESRTSEGIIQILEGLLDDSSFAILILTAEDETAAGSLRARQNVIHEAGLFQGRLGFANVILLKENRTEELSNLAGLQYIPFADQNIEQSFYELRRKLKKSGLV